MKLLMIFSLTLSIFLACAAPKGGHDGDSTSSVNKEKVLQLINDARKKGCNCGDTYYGPAPALKWNNQLEKAAIGHSADMNSKKYFSHNSPSGVTPGERMKAAGYKWTAYAENIGQGYSSEEAMVKGWLQSPGHCSNIMSRIYTEIGVANVKGYWTADFGLQ